MRHNRLCATLASTMLVFSLLPAQGLAEAMGETTAPTGGHSVERTFGESSVAQTDDRVQPATLSYRLNAQQDDAPWTTAVPTSQVPEVAIDAQPVSRLDLRLEEGTDGAIKLRTRAADAQWPAEWPDKAAAAMVSASGAFEELQVALTGGVAQTHDVWYRVHTGEQGWLGWARNGASAGTKGLGAAIDDLQIVALEKGVTPEGYDEQAGAFVQRQSGADIGGPSALSGDAKPSASPGQGSDASPSQDDGANPEVPAPADSAPDAGAPENQAVTGTSPAPNAPATANSAPAETTPANNPSTEYAPTLADVLASKSNDKAQSGPAQVVSDKKAANEKQSSSATADQASGAVLVAQSQKKTPTVSYDAHVESVGWQKAVTNGAIAGTSGRSLRVEAMHISLGSGTDGGITYRTHVQNIGWQGWVNDGKLTGTTGQSLRLEAVEVKLTGNVAKDFDVWYRGHVQNIGWQGWVKNGATAGTSGQGLRIEALQIALMPKGAGSPSSAGTETVTGKDQSVRASIAYRGHVSNMGWQGWMANGDVAGTTGLAAALTGFSAQLVGLNNSELHYSAHVQNVGWDKEVAGGQQVGYPNRDYRVEAIKMRLSGTAEKNYDIYYRLHVSNIGWMGWAKNGAAAGTQGLSGCAEAVQVMLVAKNGAAPTNDGNQKLAFVEAPNFQMRGHVQNIGWQGWVGNGGICGTSGQSLRVEALQAKVSSSISGGIQMRGHVQNIGWQGWVGAGETCGTSGQSLRVEALQMKFTGDMEKVYDIYYRVHAQNIGWMGWAKNGEYAGTSDLSMRLEAVQVQIVAKGAAAPGPADGAYINGVQIGKLGYQNPPGFYQVSRKNVTITSAARPPFNYITPSRIGVWASRQDCVNAFLQRAREYVGTPYVWNYACAPGVGVDCIGLVYQCAYACGMDLGGGTGNNDFNPWAHYVTGHSGWHSHDAENFWNYGRAAHVPLSSILPGDLISWPGHIAIYMGGDTLIEAYTPGTGVIYSRLSSRAQPRGAIRLFQ